MRFKHIDVNFDVTYDDHQNCSKTLSMPILRVFGDHHMWRQNWHQYVWTSLCQFIFFVNLLHSLCVWLFDIWQRRWGQDRGARQGGKTGGETRERNRGRNEPPGETFTTWYFILRGAVKILEWNFHLFETPSDKYNLEISVNSTTNDN